MSSSQRTPIPTYIPISKNKKVSTYHIKEVCVSKCRVSLGKPVRLNRLAASSNSPAQ